MASVAPLAYVAPVHKPTSIRHALRMHFLTPDEEDLVIAKANRLEIWRVTDEGLKCQHTKLLYGTISMIQKLNHKEYETELLFVGTERLQYFTLVWNPEAKQLDTVEQTLHDASEPYMRTSQSQNKCLVDPTGRFMMMHLWEGVLNAFRLTTRKTSQRKLEHLDQIRLTELWIRDSVFIHSRTGHPRVAFLYQTQKDHEEARVAVYRLTSDDKGNDLAKFDPHRDRELDEVIDDPCSYMIIPVPVMEEKRYHVRNKEGATAHMGGLIIVGETMMTYFDSLTYASVVSNLSEPRIYVAWEQYDEQHFFLADDYGRLDLLTVDVVQDHTGIIVTGISVEPLRFADGVSLTSRASRLVYMGNDTLFLASHHGDSQLLRFDVDSKTIALVDLLSNNAPVLDFTIMDMGNREGESLAGNAFSSGQARIVAGCGAYRDGSLRSIRSGVRLDERGMLDDLRDSRALFSVESATSSAADTIIMSFLGETRVLAFDPEGGIEEVFEFQGLRLDTETLHASNLPNGSFLQITPSSVTLSDPESGVAVNSWEVPAGRITAASANTKWALIAVDGRTLVSLDLNNGLRANQHDVGAEEFLGEPEQISCLHAAWDMPDLGVVGGWTSGSISVLNLATLEAVHGVSLRQTRESASVPRDIALVQLHPPGSGPPTLLVALEDGNVVTYNVITEPGFSLTGRKFVTLGSNPAKLHILPQPHGPVNIFATTEHSSLIYSSEGRIIYSAVTADGATSVVPFDSAGYPDSIVLATNEHVGICHIDKARLTHVKALPVYETVRRVAYSPSLKSFGLGCIKKELVKNEEVITSTFRLVDEIVFQELGKPFLLDAAATLEMVECVIRAQLPDSNGILRERFIVGTSFVADDETTTAGTTQGRILILGVDEHRRIYQIVSHNLKGSCRCLGIIEDPVKKEIPYIAAGLSKTVVVYGYSQETSDTGSLQKLAAYRTSAYPIDLDVEGTTIGVVDLMQSLALVEFTPPRDGQPAKLHESARDYLSVWASSVCSLGEGRWLEADAQGNLLVLRRNTEAPTEQDKKKLEITNDINLGEQINRIRKLNVSTSESAVVSPRAFLGSVDGSFYLFGDIAAEYRSTLLEFQNRLKEYISVPGNTDFDSWRAFINDSRAEEKPNQFIDGETIERFLDLDEAGQDEVCVGMGPTADQMRNLVEELRRVH